MRTCRFCRRDFTAHSGSAFSGYRFPPDVNLTTLRWYFSYGLSSQQVMDLLAERGLDASRRTILRWAQAFGPLLGQAVRRRRLPFGQRWFVDEVFVRIGGVQQYLYRMIDETRHVVDILLREHRDTDSAEAFFRQARDRTAGLPEEVVTDYHRPYIKALQHIWPDVRHRRSGLHRARGGHNQARRAPSRPSSPSFLVVRGQLVAEQLVDLRLHPGARGYPFHLA
jgi:IS6 family transposase